MSIDVSDVRSNPQDQIAHAARVIGRSPQRRKVFIAIYKGKQKIKTVTELAVLSSLPRKRVLEEAQKLYNNDIIKKTKVGKDLAYEKYPFFTQHKDEVLKLAGDPSALKKFPTKTNPRVGNVQVTLSLPRKSIDARQITIDDIESFAKVRGEVSSDKYHPIDEKLFKLGLQKILREEGTFQDWGGEGDDLYSTRMLISGHRMAVAFGLKGKGTRGILYPKKMGTRGDQIQRLFKAPAECFLVQYWGQIDESIIEQMKNFAMLKSSQECKRIYYGVIDGQDTVRILSAYSVIFSVNNTNELR
ncbi:MAG: hypothetical protein ACHQ03_06780 [Candidatus Bathyarchaeia archaeon]